MSPRIPAADGQGSGSAVRRTGSGAPKENLKARAIIWVVLALLGLHRTIVLEQAHLDYRAQGFALLNALMLAKAMLVADDLGLGDRYTDRPLIYSVFWHCAAFTVILICFHVAETAASAWLRGKPVAEDIAGGMGEVLAVAAIVFVMLIPFFMFSEIGRVVGADKLWHLLLARERKTIVLEVRD